MKTLVDFILAGHDVVSTHDDYNPYIASCFTGAEASGHGSVRGPASPLEKVKMTLTSGGVIAYRP